jgi:methionyl-tRNA formyltransferase
MHIIFFGKADRGASCLRAFMDSGIAVDAVAVQGGADPCAAIARQHGIDLLEIDDPNAPATVEALRARKPDLFILAGYGKILKPEIIAVPSRMTINLHAGKLPECRGSSPLNWALIHGWPDFSLSVIAVDAGVDSGDILLSRSFPIAPRATIRDLHAIANQQFPEMLVEAVRKFIDGSLVRAPQDKDRSAYYPLRFSEDGAILWDMLTAGQIDRRIRALTAPYPCAFTLFKGRRVRLLAAEPTERPFYGEPGRIYRVAPQGLLVCASDKSLWITEAVFEDDGTPLSGAVRRYECLATVREAALRLLQGQAAP